MRTPAIPDFSRHLSRVIDRWYNGRAGQSISFDPVSNPYAAALARHQDRTGIPSASVMQRRPSAFVRPAEDQSSTRRAA
jgi:hypothetical protein